jgi:DNA topoisomerase-1
MLGSDYKIMASMGHIRDLPQHSFGVDIKNHFTPNYVESTRSKKTIKELRAAAKKADAVYLAPDPDREGEAIAWHLQELLKKNYKGDFKRVTFHEITKSAIAKAFENTSEVDMHLVDAQQARRVLDRMVGYMVSPLLWSQITRGTSAGRVQTVALRLVVEREREIQNFKPEEYWNFNLILEADGEQFEVRLFKINKDKFKVGDAETAQAVFDAIMNGDGYKVENISYTDRRRNAPPPFTTSTMQQAANNLLHFSATNTMRIAQQLYEGIALGGQGQIGLITYMRTDSVNIAKEAQASCRQFIASKYGQEYVPEKPNFYRSKSGAQEAHEAVRPTDVTRTPESVAQYLDATQLKLYTLIWNRFVASQMAQGLQRQTAVDIVNRGADGNEYTFRANAMVTVFPGFMKVYGNTSGKGSENVEILGKLTEQQQCGLVKAEKEQKFTEPPPRYSEASLIKALEENGVGRPSTYATIMRTIQARDYVERDKGKLIPTELGIKVTELLLEILPDLFEIDFTSRMETELDEVEEGSIQWTQMLEEFYKKFGVWLKKAKQHGAPDVEKAKAFIAQFDSVKWEPAEKRGRRTYDDGKFFNSVKDKFAEDQTLTAKQWEALLRMGAKYREQLPDLKTIAAKYAFEQEFDAAVQKQIELEEKLNNPDNAENNAKQMAIMEAFEGAAWEAPTKRGNRTYDDKKFFESFLKQVKAGRVLSEKQIGVLQRFALKYKESITDFEKLCGLMGMDPNATEEQGAEKAEMSGEVKELLEILGKVTEWAEPVKKGRRVYDDKAFYESLVNQAQSGKTLSPKQVFALKKLAGKYQPKEG